MHYYSVNSKGQRLSLVGSVITLFDDNGFKLKQWFFDDKREAMQAFMSVVD